MKTENYLRHIFMATLLFFISISAFAQGFSLTVTPTPQSCLGNGSLSFAVANVSPGSTVSYTVYLLPDEVNYITTTSATFVNSLNAGTFKVVAVEALSSGTGFNTSIATVTIDNNIVDLEYTLAITNVTCNNNGVITVNPTQGSAVSYEIISGPMMRPLQSSPSFTGLAAGLYEVRVHDACGEALVTAVTLLSVPTSINIGNVTFAGGALPNCNSIMVANQFASPVNLNVIYPLTLTYTIYPPVGAPVTITRTITSGTNQETAETVIPFYHNQQYMYTLTITDGCGNVFTRTNNIVNQKLTIAELVEAPGCNGLMFTLVPNNYVAPYTLTFTQSPAGFDPETFNPQQPTFTGESAVYGSETQPVPEGTYEVQVSDACGRNFTYEFDVEYPEVEPAADTEANCGDTVGNISISMDNRELTQVIIEVAPTAYNGPVPQDLSMAITESGAFSMQNVPFGNYVFHVEDDCGNEYTVPVTLEATAGEEGVTVISRAGCQEGDGSVRVFGADGVLFTAVSIIDAPDSYTATLPQDVTANINDTGNTAGQFYMNNLPEGTYTIRFTDQCNFVQEHEVTVTGYHVTQNDVTIIPHCGSFDIDLKHQSTGNYTQSFWLQKYNEVTGTWGHPLTGNVYTSGLPNSSNSVILTNNTVNLNNAYTGQFRILKFFYVYNNGDASNFRCMDEVYDFEFDGRPRITDVYSFPCNEGLTDAVVVVEGVAPFTYEITTKNGQPFLLDNGAVNLFSGLEPALYNFRVTDVCGNIVNSEFSIIEEQPLQIIATGFCEGEDSSLSVPEFVFLGYQWYEQSNPSVILSTGSILNFPAYNSATDSGTYVLQIASDNPESCLNQTMTYTLTPNAAPNAGANGVASFCNTGTAVNLSTYLGGTFDAGGTWTDNDNTGALTGNIFNTQNIVAGTYHFTYTVNGFCSATDTATITVELKDTPAAPVLAPLPGVCVGGNVQLTTQAVAGATYAWTGPDGFTSSLQNPQLNNVTLAQAGDYYLTVTVNGCSSPGAMVSLAVSAQAYAGTDGTDTVCNDGRIIDLSDYIGTDAQTGGIWVDIDNTNGLINPLFNIANVGAGIYHFSYTVTNVCGTTDVAYVTITVNDIPAAPAIAAVAPLCEGSELTLVTAGVPNATYAWTGPNGFMSSLQNPVIAAATVSASGIYNLVVTVNGCASPAGTVTVSVLAEPQFTISGDAVLCEGQTTVLSVVPLNNFNPATVTYAWYKDGSLITGETLSTIEISDTGNYAVEISNGVCTSTNSFTVSPNTNAFEVVVEAGCENDHYIIRVANYDEIENLASVSWTGPSGFEAEGEWADITNGEAGVYTAVVYSQNGCSASDDVTVDNTFCKIPKGISPGDGDYNNEFDLSNLDVRHIKIFNRYGMEVYEKYGYKNEWHGQSTKGELPTGTYFYVITLSAGKQVTGWVYLLRKV